MGDPKIQLWDPILKKDVYPPLNINFEGRAGLTMVGVRPTDDVQKGKWETFEIYIKHDSVSQANGGMAVERIWKNNKLLINATHQTTAVDKTGIVDAVYLFTYWNGSAPADQYLYMDDLIMTNERPTNRDANGYAYLGSPVMAGAVPAAPGNLVVP
jgi:hypothetical protein